MIEDEEYISAETAADFMKGDISMDEIVAALLKASIAAELASSKKRMTGRMISSISSEFPRHGNTVHLRFTGESTRGFMPGASAASQHLNSGPKFPTFSPSQIIRFDPPQPEPEDPDSDPLDSFDVY